MSHTTRVFDIEVEQEASRIVERGDATPWDAVAIAVRRVLQRHRRSASGVTAPINYPLPAKEGTDARRWLVAPF